MLRSYRSAATLFLVTMLAAACQPSPPPTVTVWHASGQAADEVVRAVAEDHRQATEVQVDVRRFGDRATLLDSLAAGGSVPDVFVGPHTWGERLREAGVVEAYCLPDQCEACRGENPPEWCRYARGDFSHGRIGEMVVGTALCTEDQCPRCFGPNPPEICKVMSLSREGALDPALQPDLLQAGFAGVYDGDVFPWGIPVWWDFPVVAVNTGIIDGIFQPADAGRLEELLRERRDAVYVDPALDGSPVPMPYDVAAGDPSPQPNDAPVLVTLPRRIPALRAEIGDGFEVAAIEGYRPPIAVTGGYVSAGTGVKEAALDFLYRLADESAQERFHQATGHLPAHAEVLGEVGGQQGLGAVVEQGLRGLPALPGGGRQSRPEAGS